VCPHTERNPAIPVMVSALQGGATRCITKMTASIVRGLCVGYFPIPLHSTRIRAGKLLPCLRIYRLCAHVRLRPSAEVHMIYARAHA
jgi:hypothetical protein